MGLRLWFHPWVGKIPLEKEMTTYSSILTWEIPWTEELQSMGSRRVGHDWMTKPPSPHCRNQANVDTVGFKLWIQTTLQFWEDEHTKVWKFWMRHCSSKEEFYRNSEKRKQFASATRIQASILEAIMYKSCLENYIGLGNLEKAFKSSSLPLFTPLIAFQNIK